MTMIRLLAALRVLLLPVGAGQAARAGDEPKEVEGDLRRAAERYVRWEYNLALKDLDEAIRLDPKCALAFSGRAAAWFTKKEYDKAIKDVGEAVRLEPGRPSSGYYIRGAAYYMKKGYARAVKGLDEAIRLNPKEAEALNSRAWAAATCPEAKFRDADKALRFPRRADELDEWKTRSSSARSRRPTPGTGSSRRQPGGSGRLWRTSPTRRNAAWRAAGC
jgi:tetratricopeptide (TPR) repeat protein